MAMHDVFVIGGGNAGTEVLVFGRIAGEEAAGFAEGK